MSRILLAPRSPVPPLTHVRGTVIANSVRVVRDRGLIDRYRDEVPPEVAAATIDVTPQSWVPLEIALPHYRVLDRLIPEQEEQVAIGREAAARVQKAYLETTFRAARAAGILNMEHALSIVQKVFDRVLLGGSGSVALVGPKDAHLECFGMPVISIGYYRNSLGGWFETSFGLVSRKVIIRVIAHDTDSAVYSVAWV